MHRKQTDPVSHIGEVRERERHYYLHLAAGAILGPKTGINQLHQLKMKLGHQNLTFIVVDPGHGSHHRTELHSRAGQAKAH